MKASPAVALNETGRLRRVIMKHARDAFRTEAAIARQWQPLRFTSPPDLARAIDEYERLADIIGVTGAEIAFLAADDRTGLDSIYVRDASIVCDKGVILSSMGKELRASEPDVQGSALGALGVPVVGAIRLPGRLEGGDLIWLDSRTVAVGEGYRTNAEGIGQLRWLLGDSIDELIAVPLPHWRGPGEVLHLMSLISPVDRDLAVVYSPLLAVPFRAWLLEHGYRLIEVPDEEFDTMGTNVLALAPRECLMLSGNPRTRALLERAGAIVHEYEGSEISLKGAGGPTCLTRPLAREPQAHG